MSMIWTTLFQELYFVLHPFSDIISAHPYLFEATFTNSKAACYQDALHRHLRHEYNSINQYLVTKFGHDAEISWWIKKLGQWQIGIDCRSVQSFHKDRLDYQQTSCPEPIIKRGQKEIHSSKIIHEREWNNQGSTINAMPFISSTFDS